MNGFALPVRFPGYKPIQQPGGRLSPAPGEGKDSDDTHVQSVQTARQAACGIESGRAQAAGRLVARNGPAHVAQTAAHQASVRLAGRLKNVA